LNSPLTLHLTNPLGYSAHRAIMPVNAAWERMEDAFHKEVYEELTEGLGKYKYGEKHAHVRYSRQLPDQEKDFVRERLPKVRDALGKFLGMDLSKVPLDQIPKIGIACSGGGYRAMLASLGVLVELERQGLSDAIMYTVGLSGGAWLVSNIYGSPATTMQGVLDRLREKLQHRFYTSEIFPTVLKKELRERVAQRQVLSLIDTYSWHLHMHMYRDWSVAEDLWNLPRLSEQAQRVAGGQMSFPIYTAVTSAPGAGVSAMRWLEFTPYEAGIRDDVDAFIPMFSFGRHFSGEGHSTNFHAEPSISFMAGLFGSAFCATVDQIFSNTLENDSWVMRLLHGKLYKKFPSFGDGRLFTPCQFPNFALQGPLSRFDELSIFDAGCAFNVPLPPLMRPERGVDIMIGLDQSGGRDQENSANLTLAAEYAKKFDYPFPDCSAAVAMEKVMRGKKAATISAASTKPLTTCMGDPRLGIPTVLYMSLLRNERYDPEFDPRTAKFCGTESWVYKPAEVDLLTGLTAFNTKQSIEQIRKVFRLVLEKKMECKGQVPQGVRRTTTATSSNGTSAKRYQVPAHADRTVSMPATHQGETKKEAASTKATAHPAVASADRASSLPTTHQAEHSAPAHGSASSVSASDRTQADITLGRKASPSSIYPAEMLSVAEAPPAEAPSAAAPASTAQPPATTEIAETAPAAAAVVVETRSPTTAAAAPAPAATDAAAPAATPESQPAPASTEPTAIVIADGLPLVPDAGKLAVRSASGNMEIKLEPYDRV
jgi:phospholipase A2